MILVLCRTGLASAKVITFENLGRASYEGRFDYLIETFKIVRGFVNYGHSVICFKFLDLG